MKIALMTNNYKPFMGGVPISVERLAAGLRSMGHSVTIFAPTYEEQQEEENVFRYATLTKRFIGGIVLPNPLDIRIEREFKRQEFELIHVHHPMLIGRTAVYLSKKYNIPLVFTYHTRYEQYLSYVKGISVLEQCAGEEDGAAAEWSKDCLHLIKNRFMPAYLNTFLKNCDFIFAPTASMERYLQEVCRVPKERIGILPTGLQGRQYLVGAEDKHKIKSRYDAMNNPLFLTVSRMSHEKNIIFLLESLARLRQICNRDFRMLMVGDGPDLEEYKELCKERKLCENVIFVGAVPNEEISAYFAAADAFLFASKTETQGIVILEAFAGATPVLAVEASGVSDLVQTGYNGVLTEENVEKYTDVLKGFLEGGFDRLELGENAFQTALKYREEAVALRAADYYNRVVYRTSRNAAQSSAAFARISR